LPDFRVPPISIVNQIRNNLHDRYETGFPILKELLQNADDAGARRFSIETLSGWKKAENPLLRWPGLLAANDGIFRAEDEVGIVSFGDSGKTTDDAAIGKFGLGQKAVFHICDAFVVFAYDTSGTFSCVVNPFLNVQVTGNISHSWEPAVGAGLSDTDLELLRSAVAPEFVDRGLLLWFPFRRSELHPAPDVGFSTNIPDPSNTIDELSRTEDLALILTALRHLEHVDVRNDGITRCSLRLKRDSGRLIGPSDWQDGSRTFRGAISVQSNQTERKYVGRETTLSDGRAARLQASTFWPKTVSVLHPYPRPEKGQPHGAVSLLRTTGKAPGTLRMSWAAFLPISDTYDIEIPLDSEVTGQVRLLLHGYFFLDSGRRRIEGLDADQVDDDPGDAAELRQSWNAEIRDTAVLPLVPAVLRDAFDSRILTSEELEGMVRGIARDRVFEKYRGAICGTHALVRALEASDQITWYTPSSEASLRPLPWGVARAPRRIVELFPGIHAWARANAAVLCVDKEACLADEPMHWVSDDLEALFIGLSSRAFQAGALAPLLAEFLGLVDPNEAFRKAIGPSLVAGLRNALEQSAPMAPSSQLGKILSFVSGRILFPLPAAVEHRSVLRSLAAAQTSILPIRAGWLGDTAYAPARLSPADLKPLLEALEPHLEGAQADQAAIAALACLTGATHGLSELAASSELASIKVLRVRDVRAERWISISLELLIKRSQAGLLFASSPDANRLLPLVVAALPDACPLIVEQRTGEFLRYGDRSLIPLRNAGKPAIFHLVKEASKFGPKQARASLVAALQPSIDDDRAALRRLCAGVAEAGTTSVGLRVMGREASGIERIVTGIFTHSRRVFLVPSSVTSELTSRLRDFLDIRELDTASIEALLEEHVNLIGSLEPTATECEAFLRSAFSDDLLRRLPIHGRSDGTVGGAESAFVERDFAVPQSLRESVLTISLHAAPELRRRQEKILKPWTPADQIEAVVSLREPHHFRKEVLDALDRLSADGSDIAPDTSGTLSTKRWLVANGRRIAPEDVLALPRAVDEAARTLLRKDGEAPPFEPIGGLAVDIRQHSAFEHLCKWILPDQRSSFEVLGWLVQDARIVGRPGSVDPELVRDMALLAVEGRDPGLPGWELTKAGLVALKDDPDQSLAFVTAFATFDTEEANLAAKVLDTLAELGKDKGRVGEASWRLYVRGFRIVAQWPKETRNRVFANARVPTKGGGWRIGRAVIEDGNGIESTYLLAAEHASILRQNDSDSRPAVDGVERGPIRSVETSDRGDVRTVDLAQLEERAAVKLRSFLEPWRNRVPPDLIVVFLGLLGRNHSIRTLAEEWSAETTADIETLWADLDKRFPRQVLYPNSLPDEVDQRRYAIEIVLGDTVKAEALSGDLFDAPLGGSNGSILIGNLHKTRQGIRDAENRIRDLITLPLRTVDVENWTQHEAVSAFRQLIEKIAADCLGLRMSDQQVALEGVLEIAETVDQTTLEETKHLLRDQLPAILSELKLPTTFRAQEALREFQRKDSHLHRLSAPIEKRDALKSELWQAVSDPDAARELLIAVRSRIGEYGYSAGRVLFELFQNADDAYRQQEASVKNFCFRVEVATNGPGGFQTIHWGRRVNHLGRNPEEGRRRGHGRDLLNMLLMNFSDKRTGDDLTGKFGLGFKSVHALSDGVGIASGFIALRTVGGFLPRSWPSGLDLSEQHRSSKGQKATVIDVPFSEETYAEGRKAVDAFRAALPWLPVCARTIGRIELDDGDPVIIECVNTDFLGETAIGMVSILGGDPRRALRLDLEEGFELFVAIKADGPAALAPELPCLWNLAPLEENIPCGWLLNGPFAVDPGRGRLAGTGADRQSIFARLGGVLGERLLALHDRSLSDWPGFAEALYLDSTAETARSVFWSLLFDLFEADLDDDLIFQLHSEGKGIGRLAAERPVVPTRLSKPLDAPVRASDVRFLTAGAMADDSVRSEVQSWRISGDYSGRIVAPEVAVSLRKLGFQDIRGLTLAELLDGEMDSTRRVEPTLSERLGRLLSAEAIEREPLHQERRQLLRVAAQALFSANDGAWRPVRDLSSAAGGGEDERRMSRFAPDSALLSDEYTGAALEFFRVARTQSGYGPGAALLLEWANEADDPERRRAVFRYVIEGTQGRALAEAMRGNLPPWVVRPVEALIEDPLLADWTDEDRKRLLFELGGHYLFDFSAEPGRGNGVHADSETVLDAIHTWWSTNRTILRASYADRIYPAQFSPERLIGSDDRTDWFTMFALGCFQSIGRTQEGQHRSYIEGALRDGWWATLALSDPPEDVASWVERLQHWSSAEHLDQEFLLWRRFFVDLYSVVRWLDQYIEIVRNLPRIIEEHEVISLNDVLRPSYSPALQRLGIDAAPIARSLGIGINWIIRELLRYGFYATDDENFVVPYCWASTGRVRELLTWIGGDVGMVANADESPAIHEFVVESIGVDRARFTGDFDLPLHEIRRRAHRADLERFLAEAGYSLEAFEPAEAEASDGMADWVD